MDWWQKCPICNGTGRENKFEGGYINVSCSVCGGQKIIGKHTGRPPETVSGSDFKVTDIRLDLTTAVEEGEL